VLLARLSRYRVTVDRAFFARALLNAPVFGAVYFAVVFGVSVVDPLVPPDQVLLGRDAKEISDFVAIRYAPEIEAIGVKLGLTALALGILLGVIALGLLVLRERAHGRPPARRTGLRAALAGLLVVIALHGGALLVSMSRWPQIYAAKFWARGGLLAAIQVLATDQLRTRGVVLVLALALATFLLGPPWRWSAVFRRALEGARLMPRPRLVVLASAIAVAVTGAASLALGSPRGPARRAEGARSAPPEAPGPPHRRRSVLVIASDGLRADRLRPDVAPRLSALADRGTRFERAYVDVPRTMPSWATLMTGNHPHHHGVRSGFPRWEEVEAPLDSLPARLRKLGYRTAAVSDYAGDVFGRIDFGFGELDVPPASFPALLREQALQRSTALLPFLQSSPGRALFPEMARWAGAADPKFVASSAVAALRRMNDDPFFMVVFFSTTHFPYAAPAPYHARFTRADYTGPFRYDKTVMAGVPLIPNDADVRQIRGLYDGAVAAVDDAVGTVLDEVARLRDPDDLLIVLTSDHGEVLLEHGRWHGHGDHLFGDEGTHIPLVIVEPRMAPRRDTTLVASVDLAPTLYELLGIAPPEHLDGRSLVPALRGEPLPSRPVFAETELLLGFNPGLPDELHMPELGLHKLLEVDTEHGNYLVLRKNAIGGTLLGRQRMVRDDRWKLLYMPTPTGVVYRLFDTMNDPEELTNVLDAQPAEAARMRGLLWDWMLGDPLMTRDGDYLVPKGTSAPHR
jgi:arylsulfatase A-like enzyme